MSIEEAFAKVCIALVLLTLLILGGILVISILSAPFA